MHNEYWAGMELIARTDTDKGSRLGIGLFYHARCLCMDVSRLLNGKVSGV
jgi:hypothetical protein